MFSWLFSRRREREGRKKSGVERSSAKKKTQQRRFLLLLLFPFLSPQRLTGACDIICWARLPPLPLAIATTSGRAGASRENWRGDGAASGAAAAPLRREIGLFDFERNLEFRESAFRENIAHEG